jgi:ABC-type multidrug transport system fused ATPase/permease subunit
LTLSLLRLIDLDAGSIVIDGVDISKLPHEFVRSQIVAVPQEVCLLDGSIRFNLDPSGNASESDMVDALQKVNLWEKLAPRGGMDAIVDEKFFSKGEAQLFVFARAMLRKPTILILDEFISRSVMCVT